MLHMGQDDLLGVEEVSAYLGVGTVVIYRWCREGRESQALAHRLS